MWYIKIIAIIFEKFISSGATMAAKQVSGKKKGSSP
jgi:hypothetical protein